MKRKPHSSKATPFRTQFSVTQQELAGYLGISSSLLGMYETSRRSIPAKTLIKLAALEISLGKLKANKKEGKTWTSLQPVIKKQHEKVAGKMQVKVRASQFQLGMLAIDLEKMIQQEEQDIVWLELTDHKLSALPHTKEAEGDRLWWKIQQNKVSKRLLKANETIMKLELQIALLKAAASVHESHINKIKTRDKN